MGISHSDSCRISPCIDEFPFWTEFRKGTHLLDLCVLGQNHDELPPNKWLPHPVAILNNPFRILSCVPLHLISNLVKIPLVWNTFNLLGSTDWCFWWLSTWSKTFQAALVFTTMFLKPDFSQVVTHWMFLIFWLTEWCPCDLVCRSVEIHSCN